MNEDLLRVSDIYKKDGPDFATANAQFLNRCRKKLAAHESTSEHLKVDLDCVLARREDLLRELFDNLLAEYSLFAGIKLHLVINTEG